MKLLVTGATGFLGRALVEALLSQGEHDLRLFVRPGSARDAVRSLEQRYPAQLELCEGSLTQPSDCERALRGVGGVFHLAAAKSGASADLFLHTVVATKNLLEALIAIPKQERPRLVLCSSFSVYGVADLPRGSVVTEGTPLETRPTERDPYAQAKLRQETLCREYAAKHSLELVVLRPGVIYGPGGVALPSRVGLDLFGLFLSLGGSNSIPLTYVDNCAEAIALAGLRFEARGQTFNVVDDELPTCAQYLKRYRREVAAIPALRVPWLATMAISHANQRYSEWSQGQLPAIFTPYKSRALWGGNRFVNDRLKTLGWSPRVSTEEGLSRLFKSLKQSKRAA